MKSRGKSAGTPVKGQVSRQAFNLTKNLAFELNEGEGNSNQPTSSSGTRNLNMAAIDIPDSDVFENESPSEAALKEKQFEEALMRENFHHSENKQKSHAMEKNLNQMVKVLNSRLKSLEDAAKTRLKLCAEDLDATSTKTSKQAPKIVDEFEETLPKFLNTNRGTLTTAHAKENLVSSEQVFIDPYHLVLKTKAPTETAKKLEVLLEESYGNANNRELKNKKKSNKASLEKSKRNEQLKNETRRMNRLKFEKKLQLNMENFVTRSVMDPELVFKVPDTVNKEAEWPVSIKWNHRDPRSSNTENHEGEFDPDLLLKYSLEKINLPSGTKLFLWLCKQPMIQRYFVALFWLIKVKFFEGDQIDDQEIYLMRLLSIEYRAIMELLANRTHAEHEKDFVFKYIPFILTNSVYFGFFYVFPGSRHLYTKGFKKTIYMQIIQIMHGFQVCPISVKVSWAKLFPEDIHDDNEEGEEGGEIFPVQIAIKANKLSSSKPSSRPSSRLKRATSPTSPIKSAASETYSSSFAKSGLIVDDDTSTSSFTKQGQFSSSSKNAPQVTFSNNLPEAPKRLPPLARQGTQSSFFPGASKLGYIKSQNDVQVEDMKIDPNIQQPVLKTYLQPPLEKPNNFKSLLKRQNNVERINGEEISPQMSFFLTTMRGSTKQASTSYVQTFRRTIPVSWCPTGGSDTHHKTIISTELHNEISNKCKQSRQEFLSKSSYYHKQKIQSVNDVQKTLSKILSSGQTNISRYSLDLIRRFRNSRNQNGANINDAAPSPTHNEEVDWTEINALANYDDSEIERFLAEL